MFTLFAWWYVRIATGRFDRTLLEPSANAHGGKGEIMFRQVWGARDFKSNISHLHHLLLPPVRRQFFPFTGRSELVFTGLTCVRSFEHLLTT
eukprot:COSAG02_NODE_2030_length_10067_cov_22.885333_7_plen_92_part_00